MPSPNVLIVAVDGLRASALGAYGNTVFPTPAFDELAADSFLLDCCFAPSVNLADIYAALWQSWHPARHRAADQAQPALPRLLADRGYASTLLTDAPELTALQLAADFEECRHIVGDPRDGSPSTRAEDHSASTLARFFARAGEALLSPAASAPRLVWIHSRGMYGPWDAPLDLQRSLLDEGDPPPVEALDPPDFALDGCDDPDAAFRYACAYAAQVMTLDACWNDLLESLEQAGGDRGWLIMLIGVRGFPLGEHQRVGGVDPRLYGEQLHVPWMIQFPDGLGRLVRSGHLTSPLDLLPTLLDGIGADVSPAELTDDNTSDHGLSVVPLIAAARHPWREALISCSAAGHRAIRTEAWCLRRDPVANALGELYVRPDDRWEANDVAKLCLDEAETLAAALERSD